MLPYFFSLLEANQEELSQLQCQILSQSAKKVKDTVTRLATEHKELHGGISKIGKAIDRVRSVYRFSICLNLNL